MNGPVIVNPNEMEWKKHFTDGCEVPLFEKILLNGAENGMEVNLAHYPAGYTTIRHRHTCAHGMYVLEGTLIIESGKIEKGQFVWFPSGTVMKHGAPDDDDCTVLFITDGPFDIEYL